MPVHAHGKRFDPPHQQVRIKGRQHRTQSVLQKPDFLRKRRVLYNRHTRYHVAVARKVLRRAVKHNVGAKRQRPLQVRRHKGVVRNHKHILFVRDARGLFNVRDRQHGVGRGFDKKPPNVIG